MRVGFQRMMREGQAVARLHDSGLGYVAIAQTLGMSYTTAWRRHMWLLDATRHAQERTCDTPVRSRDYVPQRWSGPSGDAWARMDHAAGPTLRQIEIMMRQVGA
jgi:hypothetical protein